MAIPPAEIEEGAEKAENHEKNQATHAKGIGIASR